MEAVPEQTLTINEMLENTLKLIKPEENSDENLRLANSFVVECLAPMKWSQSDANSFIEYRLAKEFHFEGNEGKGMVSDLKKLYEDTVNDNLKNELKIETKRSKTQNDKTEKSQTIVNDTVSEWDKYVYPDGYSVKDGKVVKAFTQVDFKTGEVEKLQKDVSFTPFILCGKTALQENQPLYFTVRYATDAAGKDQREFVATMQELLDITTMQRILTGHGINVPSNQKTEVNEYIGAFIHKLGNKLRLDVVATRNGWNQDCSGFALGKHRITSTGVSKIITTVTENKLYETLRQEGTEQGWINGVSGIFEYRQMRHLFYNAHRAPLIKPMCAESSALGIIGPTGKGKTGMSNVISSSYGSPKELEVPAHSTDTYICDFVAGMSNLPIDIEEVTKDTDQKKIADIIYRITNGNEKGRSKQNGGIKNKIESYRTVAHFSGENSIRTFMPNAGAQYRAPEFTDMLPDGLGKQIDDTKSAIQRNFGFFFPRYVQKIIENLDALNELYEDAIKALDLDCSTLSSDSKRIADRSKRVYAGNIVSGILCEMVFSDMGMKTKTVEEVKAIEIEYFKKCVIDSPVEADYIRALRYLADYVAVEKHRKFCVKTKGKFNHEEFNATPDHDKYIGNITDTHVEVIGTEFSEIMSKGSYSPDAVKKAMIENGIGSYISIWVNKINVKGIRINKHEMDSVIGYVDITGTDAKSTTDAQKFFQITELINVITRINGAAEKSEINMVFKHDVTEYLTKLSKEGKVTVRPDGKYVTI